MKNNSMNDFLCEYGERSWVILADVLSILFLENVIKLFHKTPL